MQNAPVVKYACILNRERTEHFNAFPINTIYFQNFINTVNMTVLI